MNPINRASRIIAVCALPLAVLFCTSLMADEEPIEDSVGTPLSLDELRTFSDVYNAVRRNYVDSVPGTELLDNALRGMVDELDGYSNYLSPEEIQRLDDSASGQYVGIGVTLEIRSQRLYVEAVAEDGPARRGGVKPGDIILEVNGVPVKGRPLQDSMSGLLGPSDTDVTVQFRTGQDPPRDVTLTRAYIPVPSVQGTLLPNDVALIHIINFNKHTGEEARDSLLALLDEADGSLAGVIIDLRDNPGGIVQGATLVADGFLESGLVIYTRGRYPASQMEYFAEPGEWVAGVPLVILVNGASASASEILAGALQDYGRALILGSETFGKGSVQSILRLRNGSGLKLTTARYYTPAGRSFDETGITPDITMDEPGSPDDRPGKDATIQQALELILEGKAPQAAQPLAAALP